MPDHIHMLAFVAREGGNLLSFVHAFKRQSGFALTRLGKSAPVWQRDLWDRHTRSDADVEDAVDYILRNPVVAGLCEHPEDWPHSEFHGYPW
jgi:REP element-mobilizing transposase RayT